MKLIVVIPAYNEEKTIREVIRRIPDLQSKGIKVLPVVIDDGSTDHTAEYAREAGAVVLPHFTNQGVGKSFRDGLAYAVEKNADIMVNIDADLQYDPADILKLIQPILDGKADFVTANRFARGARPENMPAIKFWGNQRMNRLVNSLAGTRLGDVSSGFRAISREAILNLNLSGNYTYTHETIIDLAFKQMRLVSVPIDVKYYPERKSKIADNLFSYTNRALRIIFKSFKDYKPFYFFSLIALPPGVLGLACLVFILIHYIQTHEFTPYKFVSFAGIYLVSLAILLVIVGFLADIMVGIRITTEKQLYLQKKAIKQDPDEKEQ